MGKRKPVKKVDFYHPAIAVTNAFSAVKDLTCTTLSEARRVSDVVSSGSLALDLILGGGWPRGRFATIFGPEGSGKSTYLQELIACCQRLKITVVHYDFEAGSDPVYMRTQGIDLDYTIKVPQEPTGLRKANRKQLKFIETPNYFYCQPYFGEQAYRHTLITLKHLPDIEEGGPPRIVFIYDSFAAMSSEEVDDETGESRIAPNALMHSNFLRLIRPKLRLKGAFLVGSNQMRVAIGSYGNPQKEAGGSALMYYPDQKVMITRRKMESDASHLEVQPGTLRTLKNRVFLPHRIIEGVGILLGRGIDKALDTRVFLQKLGYCQIKHGKTKIDLPDQESKFLSWNDFREVVENRKFRRSMFNLLRQDETYARYHETEKNENFTYDKLSTLHQAEEELDKKKLKKQVDEEAEEYRQERKTRSRRGKSKRSRKQRRRDEALEEG